MKLNKVKTCKSFLHTLGEKYTVRRYNATTDTFASDEELLVVEPQSITYRPLNRFKTTMVGQPVPIARIKVYSDTAFTDFRDEVDYEGDTYRVRETSLKDTVTGLHWAMFSAVTKESGA